MLIFFSVIFGIIQGLTEFLPVSSSGHLSLLHYFFDLPLSNSFTFDIALHWGTLLALLIFFWQDILGLLKAFFSSFRKWDLSNNFNQRLSWMLLVSSIPVFVVGYLISGAAEDYFRQPKNIAIILIVFGILFFVYEKISRKELVLSQLSFRSALKIGLVQVLALIPGVSRSGITIIAGLGENLKREEAARFSFLLSIPAVFGAGVKKFFDVYQSGGIPDGEAVIFIVGFLTSAAVGLLCIKYFLKFLKQYSLNIFGWYRIILGVLVLTWLYYYGK